MIWLARLRNKLVLIIFSGLILTGFFIWLAIFETWPTSKIKISFFDVGQGSAIFLAAQNGNQVLVDGGPSDAILAKLGENLPLFDKKIELLILTHPDSDHLNGLIEVLKKYEVGAVLESGIDNNSSNYLFWHKLLKENNVPVYFAYLGQTIKIADGLQIKILAPLVKIAGWSFESTNNTSIAGKIIYGRNSLIFTGDAEKAEETQLIFSGLNLKAQILSVGHHGSKNSSSDDFLAAVGARTAVIQVGKNNRYGHPSQEALERLKNSEIWRTDLSGDINFECDLKECFKID